MRSRGGGGLHAAIAAETLIPDTAHLKAYVVPKGRGEQVDAFIGRGVGDEQQSRWRTHARVQPLERPHRSRPALLF